jgi:hypothetical protein
MVACSEAVRTSAIVQGMAISEGEPVEEDAGTVQTCAMTQRAMALGGLLPTGEPSLAGGFKQQEQQRPLGIWKYRE